MNNNDVIKFKGIQSKMLYSMISEINLFMSSYGIDFKDLIDTPFEGKLLPIFKEMKDYVKNEYPKTH